MNGNGVEVWLKLFTLPDDNPKMDPNYDPTAFSLELDEWLSLGAEIEQLDVKLIGYARDFLDKKDYTRAHKTIFAIGYFANNESLQFLKSFELDHNPLAEIICRSIGRAGDLREVNWLVDSATASASENVRLYVVGALGNLNMSVETISSDENTFSQRPRDDGIEYVVEKMRYLLKNESSQTVRILLTSKISRLEEELNKRNKSRILKVKKEGSDK